MRGSLGDGSGVSRSARGTWRKAVLVVGGGDGSSPRTRRMKKRNAGVVVRTGGCVGRQEVGWGRIREREWE